MGLSAWSDPVLPTLKLRPRKYRGLCLLGHDSYRGLLITKQDLIPLLLAPYQFLEPVFQTVLPRTGNYWWFQEELVVSREAVAKLAQASLAAMLPFLIFLQSQFRVTNA